MLPKRSRISGKVFPALLSRGRRARGTLCRVVFVREPYGLGGQAAEPRCACVVSKRIARKAVTRNRLRRRCYAAIGHIYPRLTKGSCCIVFPDEAALDAPLPALEREINSLLEAILQKD